MHHKHNLLKTTLCLLLSSCIPTVEPVIDTDPLSVRVDFIDGYTTLVINPGPEKAINVVLQFSGTDVRFNEPRCKVMSLKTVCNLGDVAATYRMPFLGIMNHYSVSYYRIDGSLHTKE